MIHLWCNRKELLKEIEKLKQEKRKLELEAQYLKAVIEENKLCAGRMAGMSCPEYYFDLSRRTINAERENKQLKQWSDARRW